MIVDTAIAMDGGSLSLSLVEGEDKSGYLMNRSIASVNTPRYEEISSETGVLSFDERVALLRRLQALRSTIISADPNAYVIEEFIISLKRA